MNEQLTRQTLAMRMQHAHDNKRLREALTLIADMAEHSTSALTMPDIARIARGALIAAPVENPDLKAPQAPTLPVDNHH